MTKPTTISKSTLIPMGLAIAGLAIAFSVGAWVSNVNNNDKDYSEQLETLADGQVLMQREMTEMNTQITLINATLNSQDISYAKEQIED